MGKLNANVAETALNWPEQQAGEQSKSGSLSNVTCFPREGNNHCSRAQKEVNVMKWNRNRRPAKLYLDSLCDLFAVNSTDFIDWLLAPRTIGDTKNIYVKTARRKVRDCFGKQWVSFLLQCGIKKKIIYIWRTSYILCRCIYIPF